MFWRVLRRRIASFPAIPIIVLFAAALFHFPSLFAPFQSDDFTWLRLSSWHSVLGSFHGAWGHGVAYRPLSRLSFYVDHLLFGSWAAGWHAENLALDALCGCGVYALARKLELIRVPALFAALLFSVSPLGSENVDWISGRTGLLCLAFLLWALVFWIEGFTARRCWTGTAGLFVLSLMTYESAIVLPLLACVMVPFLHGRLGIPWRRQVAPLLALALAGLGFWAWRAYAIGSSGTDVDPFYRDAGVAIRLNSGSLLRNFRGAWGIGGLTLLMLSLFRGLTLGKTRLACCALMAMAVIFTCLTAWWWAWRRASYS